MQYVYFLIYTYILLKPFYLIASGLPQVSDFILLLAFVAIMLTRERHEIYKSLNRHYKFFFFVCCVFIINICYAVQYSSFQFILASCYYVFNLLALLVFSIVFREKKQLIRVGWMFKIDIILQVLIFLLGKGRWYDAWRYMGTFNDPNQLGYFILLSFAFVYTIQRRYSKSRFQIFLFFILSLFVIVQTGSTGMFLGLSIVLFMDIIIFLKRMFFFLKKNIYNIIVVCVVFTPLVGIVFLMNSDADTNKNDVEELVIIRRFKDKFNRANVDEKEVSLIEERGYDRFIYYPQYVIIGAGEGVYKRFLKTQHQLEIHATLPALLFYYGIFPTILLLSWICDQFKKSRIDSLVPMLSLLLESFTLANQRQSLFWAMVLLMGVRGNRNTEIPTYHIETETETEIE